MARFTEDVLRHILSFHGTILNVAVETGTYKGKTTALLSKYFDIVHTFEIDTPLYFEATAQRLPNVFYNLGDSAEGIRRLVIEEPVFWYLDAHWFKPSDGGVVGGRARFPLWKELAVIRERKYPDCIVIDDAHNFGHELPQPMWRDVTPDNIIAHLHLEPSTYVINTFNNEQFVISRLKPEV